MIKGVVFDIGATLVTGPPIAPNKVISQALGNISHTQVSGVIMTQPTECPQDALDAVESLTGNISDEAKQAIRQLWTDQCTAPVGLPGASETVCSLKDLGYRIGLLSDIWTPYYKGVENAIPEVINAAQAIILSCKSGRRKPDLHNFQLVCDELELKPDEIVMVGDTYTHDIAPALQIGMKAIWVLARPEREKQSLLDILNGLSPRPTITVEDITAVTYAVTQL